MHLLTLLVRLRTTEHRLRSDMQSKFLLAVCGALLATTMLGAARANQQGLVLRGPIDLPASAQPTVPLILPPQLTTTSSPDEASQPKDKKHFWAIPHPHLHLPVISLKPHS